MDAAVVRKLALYLSLPAASALLGSCVTAPPLAATRNQIIISVRDQRLTVVKEDHTRETFPISTSKFGLGDRRGTYETPTGRLAVAEKIGGGSAPGTVFHGRVRTGEIVKVDAPGRDAIVTRILALRGLEPNNSQAFSRGIYIHGTPEERNIGRPTSYGCIRMRSQDVIKLYDLVKVGATVQIIDTTMNQALAANIVQPPPGQAAPAAPSAPNLPAVIGGNPVASTAGATKTIVTSGDNATGATTTTTTTVTPAAVAAARKVTVTTTTKATAATPPAAPTAKGKKEWAGTPTKLLAKQAAAEAKARNASGKLPIGAPSPSPVSNNSSNASSVLHRPSYDSL
jgi:hypothetical protein